MSINEKKIHSKEKVCKLDNIVMLPGRLIRTRLVGLDLQSRSSSLNSQWFVNQEQSEFEPIAKRGSTVLETSEEEYDHSP